jgi:hypothetical protein
LAPDFGWSLSAGVQHEFRSAAAPKITDGDAVAATAISADKMRFNFIPAS